MSTNLYITVDDRVKRKNNRYPITFRLIHDRKSTSIKSGFSVKLSDWDEKKLRIKTSCKQYQDIAFVNAKIVSKHSDMLTELDELRRDNTLDGMDILQVKEEITGKSNVKSITLLTYTDQLIEELKKVKRIGTAQSYKDVKGFIQNYHGRDIKFQAITPKFLQVLEDKYMAIPTNHRNGLGVYMRGLRAIFNKAINDKLVMEKFYPFSRNNERNKYSIRTEPTRKRSINKEIIQQIEQYETEPGTWYSHAKNYFLFSFYMRGINFIDMAKLKKSNIQNGYLYYTRSKTKSASNLEMQLNDKAKAILELYGYSNKKKDDFLFPIIKRVNNIELARKDWKNAAAQVNKYITLIAKELGYDIKLTTYVTRHSWATIADRAGIDRRKISHGLGHKSLSITDVYIDDIVSQEEMNEMDEMIIG